LVLAGHQVQPDTADRIPTSIGLNYYSGMKRRTPPRRRMSPAKKAGSATTVDDYLASVPQPARRTLMNIREAIRSVVPAGTTEVLSYKIPAFKYKEVLVWYAAFSDHCSLFPTAAVIEQFKDELKLFRKSKGTIHFPIDKPLPASLIKTMVKARLAQVEAKSANS
jgi:uncharacterized protein YdhG (YjbR/CyaY superfamily)